MIPFSDRVRERFESQHLKTEILITLGGFPMTPTFRFSANGVYYPWGVEDNTPEFFEPAIAGVGRIRQAIDHLPTPEPRGTGLRRALTFELYNRIDEDGVALIDRIEQAMTIPTALVSMSELTLDPNDPREADGFRVENWNLKTGGAKDDMAHVIRFVGRVRRYSMATQERIVFECVSEVPDAWNFPVFLSEMDPRHYGLKITQIYGQNIEKVQGLNFRVPDTVRGLPSEYATLLESFAAGALPNVAMSIPDRDSWAASGSLRIGKEQLGYSAITDITDSADVYFGRPDTYRVQISARGQTTPVQGPSGGNATVDAAHNQQDLVSRRTDIDAIEGRELVVGFAQLLATRISQVYVTDALDGFAVVAPGAELLPQFVTHVNYEPIGFPCSVVSWDLDQLGVMVRTLAQDAQVTQQPSFETDPGSGTVTSSIVPASNKNDDGESAASEGSWSTFTDTWTWSDGGPRERLEVRYDEGDIVSGRDPGDTINQVKGAALIGYRFVWVVEAEERNNVESVRDIDMFCTPRNFPPHSNQTSQIEFGESDFPGEDIWRTKTKRIPGSGYSMDLPAGSTVQDLIDLNIGFDFYCKRRSRYEGVNESRPAMRLKSGEWGLQYQYAIGATVVDPITPVEIFARGDAIDYRFFVDCDGAYDEVAVDPETNPANILKAICESTWPYSFGHLTTDDPSWDDAETWLGGISLDIVPLEYGGTLETQFAGIGYQGRCQVVSSEREPDFDGDLGMRYRILSASQPLLPNSALYGFAAPTVTIDQYESVGFEGRDADSIFTGFRAFYRPERSQRIGDKGFSEVYEHLHVGGVDRSDFTNAPADLTAIRNDYGDWNSPIFEFQGIGEPLDASDNTIADVFGYYIQELTRDAKVWIVRRVPWVQHAALELGDTVSLEVPWLTAAQKCRVLEIDRSFEDGFANLRVVGVI